MKDQRLRLQRVKQHVILSVLLCLLAFGLAVFFLFAHSVLVDDDGIKVLKVTVNKQDSLAILAIKATLKIRSSSFYCVAGSSLFSQGSDMNTAVGLYEISNTSLILSIDRGEQLVNILVQAETGGSFSCVYFSDTFPDVQVHSTLTFMGTSVQISYLCHMTQSCLEIHHYLIVE